MSSGRKYVIKKVFLRKQCLCLKPRVEKEAVKDLGEGRPPSEKELETSDVWGHRETRVFGDWGGTRGKRGLAGGGGGWG